jgi:hypothetical protein
LWQVEARDNPSFRAYKRLDLFYVDNWSIGLDLCIMGATARMLVSRVVSTLFRSRDRLAKIEPGELASVKGEGRPSSPTAQMPGIQTMLDCSEL